MFNSKHIVLDAPDTRESLEEIIMPYLESSFLCTQFTHEQMEFTATIMCKRLADQWAVQNEMTF